jgi:hypothetical protein
MTVVACNKCGETVQDDPQQALGTIHFNGTVEIDSCSGTFVEMSEDDASKLNEFGQRKIKFGTT